MFLEVKFNFRIN